MPNSKNPYQPNMQLEGWSPPQHQQQQPIQQQQQPDPIVIVTQPQGIQYAPVGPNSMRMQCPSCRADIKTRVKHKATSNTHCWACGLCICL